MSSPESRAYSDFSAERIRAHEKHGVNSAEGQAWKDPLFLTIVGEEFGEICKAFNEYSLGNYTVSELRKELREELVQTGAMCAAWIDSIDAVEGVL